MKGYVFFLIKAVVCIVFGLAFIIFPAFTSELFGIELNIDGTYFAQFFGIVFLAIGFICISTSSTDSNILARNILLSLAVADTVGFAFSLYYQIDGFLGGLGWLTVFLWGFFAVGCWLYWLRSRGAT
ncbi:MAG: hypothetical protein KAU17_09525 [Spirochaetales bacterium]|nr:hypothetical protein [Spirochaetales bacterium]